MSRWHSTGPLAAVKEFLSRHPEFAVRLIASALSRGVHGLDLLSSQAVNPTHCQGHAAPYPLQTHAEQPAG